MEDVLRLTIMQRDSPSLTQLIQTFFARYS